MRRRSGGAASRLGRAAVVVVATSVSSFVGVGTASGGPASSVGPLDTGFGQHGGVLVDGVTNLVGVQTVQGGGILVCGMGYGQTTHEDFAVVKYRGDGSLDESFGSHGTALVDFNNRYDIPTAMLPRSDGTIVLVGNSNGYTSDDEYFDQPVLVLTRLTARGRLDSSFGSGGRVSPNLDVESGAVAARLLPDGDILVLGWTQGSAPTTAGIATGPTPPPHTVLVRFLPDGQLDRGFGDQGVAQVPNGEQAYLADVLVRDDGKIVLAGPPSSGSGVVIDRFNADGSPDSTFGQNGTVSVALAGSWRGQTINSGNAILLTGFPPKGPPAVAKLRADGSVDPTFGTAGLARVPDGADTLTVDPRLRILVSSSHFSRGSSSSYELAVTRLTATGVVDRTFGVRGVEAANVGNDPHGWDDPPVSSTLQPDGKLIVWAVFYRCGCNHYDNSGEGGLARFLPGFPAPLRSVPGGSTTAISTIAAAATGSPAATRSALPQAVGTQPVAAAPRELQPGPRSDRTVPAVLALGAALLVALAVAVSGWRRRPRTE